LGSGWPGCSLAAGLKISGTFAVRSDAKVNRIESPGCASVTPVGTSTKVNQKPPDCVGADHELPRSNIRPSFTDAIVICVWRKLWRIPSVCSPMPCRITIVEPAGTVAWPPFATMQWYAPTTVGEPGVPARAECRAAPDSATRAAAAPSRGSSRLIFRSFPTPRFSRVASEARSRG
jgi:hypothetical protein